MDKQQAFQRINDILAETDYNTKITDIRDIESFLLDHSNRRFLEQYVAIGKIYDTLRGHHVTEDYPNAHEIRYEQECKNPEV